MSNAYILPPVRTPIGKFGGALASVPAANLAALVLQEVLRRTGVDAAQVDEAIVAQSYQSSEAPCMGRYAASLAGLRTRSPATPWIVAAAPACRQ